MSPEFERAEQQYDLSILDILANSKPECVTSCNLQMRGIDGETRYLHLMWSQITLDKEQYQVATFYDETERKALSELRTRSQMVSLYQSSLSHEMLSPLKCIASFAKSIE